MDARPVKTLEMKPPLALKTVLITGLAGVWIPASFVIVNSPADVAPFLPVLFTLTPLCLLPLQSRTINLEHETIGIKTAFGKKLVHVQDLLNFEFHCFRDHEVGLRWSFNINTLPLDFQLTRPASFHDCIAFARELVQAAKTYRKDVWSEIIATSDAVLTFENGTLKLNGVQVRSVSFRSHGEVIIFDEAGTSVSSDLRPLLRDFYLFLAFFEQKIGMEFFFETTDP